MRISAAALLPLAGLSSAAVRRSPDESLMPRQTSGLDRLVDQEMPALRAEEMLPAPTPAPDVKPRYATEGNLLARDAGPNTCGFLHYNDDLAADVYPLTCNTEYLCTNVGEYRDCCREESCASATFSTSCVDSTACPSGGPSPGTICCTFDTQYPYCATYLWSSSTATNDIFTVLNCRVDPSERIGILEADETSLTTSESTSETETPSDTPTSPTSDGTSSPAPTNTGDGGDDNNDDDGGSTNTGAIVGGVVGGVAALGLGVVALIYFLRKRKAGKFSETSSPPAPGFAPSPHQQPPQPQMMAAGVYGQPHSVSPGAQGGYPTPVQGGPMSPGVGYTGYGAPAPEAAAQMQQGQTMSVYGSISAASPGAEFGAPGAVSPGPVGMDGAGYAKPQQGPPQGPYFEAPAHNPAGSMGNRAELG